MLSRVAIRSALSATRSASVFRAQTVRPMSSAWSVASGKDDSRVRSVIAMPAVRSMATKSNEDLAKFLTDEIVAEKGNQRAAPKFKNFKVEADGAELKLTRDFQGEKIVIQLNVNHTVDSAEPDDGSQEAPEMKSKPNFEVDIVKPNGRTLSFSCSYIYDQEPEQPPQEGELDDVFAIDEVTMFEGEWTEKNYAVAGDILDGYLYDLFMNMLDERGINREFADELSAYSSSYEHSLYIKMLEDLQKFAKP